MKRLSPSFAASLGDPSTDAVVVLHGTPGAGKSELAREFARRHRNAYPGGTFIVEAGKQAIMVDLARLGQTILGLDVLPGMRLEDQGLQTLSALGAAPTLLIYDNVQAADVVLPWLPPTDMPCRVIMTTTLDRWDAGWLEVEVTPLSHEASLELITRLSGHEVSVRYGERLAQLAGGLPVQLVPAAATLAYEARRGRLDAASLTLTREAQGSFLGVYKQLEPTAQLLRACGRATRPSTHSARRTTTPHNRGSWLERWRIPAVARCLSRSAFATGRRRVSDAPHFAAFVLDTPASEEITVALESGRARPSETVRRGGAGTGRRSESLSGCTS